MLCFASTGLQLKHLCWYGGGGGGGGVCVCVCVCGGGGEEGGFLV